MFPNSGQINKLLNIVPSQDILWTNAGSFKDSRRPECPSRENDKTWRTGYEWLRSNLCSSNCIVNIFNSNCTSTPAINKITIPEYANNVEMNTYPKITRTTRCLTKIFKFIMILVINVMMSGIRSSSCFDVNVPENNENETTSSKHLIILFVYSPGPSLDGCRRVGQNWWVNCGCDRMILRKGPVL